MTDEEYTRKQNELNKELGLKIRKIYELSTIAFQKNKADESEFKAKDTVHTAILSGVMDYIFENLCKTKEEKLKLTSMIVGSVTTYTEEMNHHLKLMTKEKEKKDAEIKEKFKINIESLRKPSKQDVPGQIVFPESAFFEVKKEEKK